MPKWIKILLIIWFIFLPFIIYGIYLSNKNDSYIVNGDSMYPTLKNNNLVTAYKQTPTVGDIIIFSYNGQACRESPPVELIKRLIKIDANNNFWVEGDNKSNSCDSRSFGWVTPEQRQFIGVVKL